MLHAPYLYVHTVSVHTQGGQVVASRELIDDILQDWVGSRAFVHEAQQRRLAQISSASGSGGGRRSPLSLVTDEGSSLPTSANPPGEAAGFPAKIMVGLTGQVGYVNLMGHEGCPAFYRASRHKMIKRRWSLCPVLLCLDCRAPIVSLLTSSSLSM